ncbi:MAG: hypothetical protein NTV84_12120 [Methanoregula sp.]|nr:hypothetical protein [Methanoregula sp.]
MLTADELTTVKTYGHENGDSRFHKKNNDPVLFLGVWEQINNPSFNSTGFEGIRNCPVSLETDDSRLFLKPCTSIAVFCELAENYSILSGKRIP